MKSSRHRGSVHGSLERFRNQRVMQRTGVLKIYLWTLNPSIPIFKQPHFEIGNSSILSSTTENIHFLFLAGLLYLGVFFC